MRIVTGFLLAVLAFGLAACEEAPKPAEKMMIEGKILQSGWFRDAACEETAVDKRMCTCKANVMAAKTGIEAIDAELTKLDESRFCPGERTEVDGEPISNIQRTIYEVTRNDERWLGILYDHGKMTVGAAHGIIKSEVRVYDKKNKRWVSQGELVPSILRQKAIAHVFTELQKANTEKYYSGLQIGNIEGNGLISSEGCRGCVIYPTEDGWMVRFDYYVAAPYSIGRPEVPLDESFIVGE